MTTDIVTRLRTAGCVFAEEEAEILLASAAAPDDLETMVARRAAGHPLEQVVGWAEFHGLRILVDPEVFVPRRRTEFLVSQALAHAGPHRVVVDLCCGTGALGAAIRAGLGEDVELHAADVHPAAVRCARRNLPGAQVYEGDLFDPLPATLKGRVGILAANVPYVPTGEVPLLPTEARDHEPHVTLDGGEDGLDVLRRVAAQAAAWLAPGGILLFEATERQAAQAVQAVEDGGLAARVLSDEEWGATVVMGGAAAV
jgi:release factor glutamine methyltransferase